MSCVAIIVAAGHGRRMGFDKLMTEIAGKSVLQWSLDAFLASEEVSSAVVVTNEERFATLQYSDDKPVSRIDGGSERYLSVVEGFKAAPPNCTYAAIHDGARPLVRPEQIDQCISEARDCGAAALARQATETLKKVSNDGFTRSSVPRENLWIMETPQVFRMKMLTRAYDLVLARRMQVTDDVSAAEAIGVPTKVVENIHPNHKITVPADLPIVEALLKARLSESAAP
jgi:2-C-methyl-D-erythritol 4-phosphate cytidylyltransferase